MRTLVVIALLAASPCWAQEVAYVTDSLRLGIHRAQDTSDAPFRNLLSGTELTVLERVTNYARVRTPEGEEGWVRSAFIVSEKPARLRVEELTAELEQARSEAEEASRALAEWEASTGQLNAELQTKIAAADAVQGTLVKLQSQNESYSALVDQYRGSVPWPWVVGALVVAFAAGIGGGIWWVDRSIRKRFGGHRIY